MAHVSEIEVEVRVDQAKLRKSVADALREIADEIENPKPTDKERQDNAETE